MNFGPWVGELGWEICWAIPMLRHLKATNGLWLRVAAPIGHEYLWQGVADQYVPVFTDGGRSFVDGSVAEWPKRRGPWHSSEWLWKRFGKREKTYLLSRGSQGALSPKAWAPYVEPAEHHADVLLAVRPPKRGDALKSWPQSSTEDLAMLLQGAGLSVATIGGLDNQSVGGVCDLRGIGWPQLTAAIRGAMCVIGPSSGAIHYAALSEAAHIVTWYARPEESEFRHVGPWNPFDVPVTFIRTNTGEFPSPERVMEAIR